MPTTSSPWASPSSPAGRRLLLTEPATLDAVPVLDDATFAALALAASPREVCASVPACGGQMHKARAITGRRAVLVAAAVLIAVLGIAVPVLRPSTDEPVAAAAGSTMGSALVRAAGPADRLDPMPPVATTAADGEVVVALVDRTDALGAAPLETGPSLAARLGTLVDLAAIDAA